MVRKKGQTSRVDVVGIVAPPSPASGPTEVADWTDLLPRLNPVESELRARADWIESRVRPWGLAVARHLPEVMASWWPYEGAGEYELLFKLRDPEGAERDLVLGQMPVRVGRGEACAVQLPSPTVSTEHLELRVDRGIATVMDLRSTNHTRLNGHELEPLSPVALRQGDRLDIGPFSMTFVDARAVAAGSQQPAVREEPSRLLKEHRPFRLFSHPADRWMRVRWGGDTAWVRVPIQWIRGCWQSLSEIRFEDGWAIDSLEEGVAQFVVQNIAKALGDRLRAPIQIESWLTAFEADRIQIGDENWLLRDIWIGTPPFEIATSVLLPVGSQLPPAPDLGLDDFTWPVSVCAGLIRLRLSDWRRVDPGDAMLPDTWLLEGWGESSGQDCQMGPVVLMVGGFWHTAQLRREKGVLILAMEKLWLRTPGGGLFPPGKEETVGEAESVPVGDLELQVVIELERFPVTLGELKQWQPGKCLTLKRVPTDPVHLVVETGTQRRVLADGRMVMVEGRLGVEVTRLLTQFQDAPK